MYIYFIIITDMFMFTTKLNFKINTYCGQIGWRQFACFSWMKNDFALFLFGWFIYNFE